MTFFDLIYQFGWFDQVHFTIWVLIKFVAFQFDWDQSHQLIWYPRFQAQIPHHQLKKVPRYGLLNSWFYYWILNCFPIIQINSQIDLSCSQNLPSFFLFATLHFDLYAANHFRGSLLLDLILIIVCPCTFLSYLFFI